MLALQHCLYSASLNILAPPMPFSSTVNLVALCSLRDQALGLIPEVQDQNRASYGSSYGNNSP